jgi:hypothetical protein
LRVYVTKFTGLTEVCAASYHYSVVKVLVLKRATLYSPRFNLSRVFTDKKPMLSNIGASDCKTNRLVSLTGRRFLSCQRSVLGGRDLIDCTAKYNYMDFTGFVKGNREFV